MTVNKTLQTELLNMEKSDQLHRAKLQELGQKYGFDSPDIQETLDKQNCIDAANSKRLSEIIEAYGWPGKSLVGDQAATAAWLILQHTDLAKQQKYLPLVREAVSNKELAPRCLAYLEDRILVQEGNPQIYGTQMYFNAQGKLECAPIEDEANVDIRRESMGLPSLAIQLAAFGEQ